MNREQLQALCAGLAGAQATLYAAPSNVLVFAVGGKRFAYFKTSEPERWRFSLKVTPERFLELTDQPGIKPARWLGRYRWITIVDVQRMPEPYLRELVAWSYRHAANSLSRARRAALGIDGGR